MPKPLVTIITPTYNHEAYIADCLLSTTRQTYPRWEQIVVDDGSQDRTVKIVSQFSDRRIRLLVQEHRGPYGLRETYNKALQAARGDFIAILEGDDFWPVEKLEAQLGGLNDPDFVLSHGLCCRTDATGQKVRRTETLPQSARCNKPLGSATAHLLTKGGFSHSSALLIRRGALELIGGFQGHPKLPFVDVPTLMELGLSGSFRWENRILGYHRYHRGCVTLSEIEWLDVLSEYKVSLFRRNSQTLKPLGVTERKIVESGERAKYGRLLYRGRVATHKRDWCAAAALFRRAGECQSLKGRSAAAVGLLGAKLRLNLLERLSKGINGYEIGDLLKEQGPDACARNCQPIAAADRSLPPDGGRGAG